MAWDRPLLLGPAGAGQANVSPPIELAHLPRRGHRRVVGIHGLVTGIHYHLNRRELMAQAGTFQLRRSLGGRPVAQGHGLRAGRAHQRLTPSNCDALLFDDVLWVDNAKRDHFDFMQKMRDRGVDVVEMHNLLAETVAIPEAKKWILDNQVVPNQVGLGLVDEIKSYLEGLSSPVISPRP